MRRRSPHPASSCASPLRISPHVVVDPERGLAVFVCCWSAKGGAGTTVVAAALALQSPSLRRALLVDLAGDLPAALGLPEPDGPGVAEWSRGGAVDPVEPHLVPVTPRLELFPRGAGAIDAVPRDRFASWSRVVVDVGVVHDAASGAAALVASASHSLLVTRACYLALRRATRLPIRAGGVVLVSEPGRALSADDVAAVVGVPIVAEVPYDPGVGRAVDAGLLVSRCPSALTGLLVDEADR